MKVLISPGYGAGWSTWGCQEMATDKDLIKLFEEHCTCQQMEEACAKKNFKDEYGFSPYMGGFEGLTVEEVPKGALFKIREYDGNEYIEIFNQDEWIMAGE